MLYVSGQAHMDACSYFHFLQCVGAAAQRHPHCGQIVFHYAEMFADWPRPLYAWSVLLAHEAPPAFHFTKWVIRQYGQERWIGLEATAHPSTLALISRFGWPSLPVLCLAPLTPEEEINLAVQPEVSFFASCTALRICTDADGPALQLAFAQKTQPLFVL